MNKRAEIPAVTVDLLRRMDAKCLKQGDCLLWQGGTVSGYGVMTIRGKQLYVHRLAAAWKKGLDVSDPAVVVRHKCNNRLCLAEAHIILGTHQQNAQDREESGRHYVPSTNPLQPG